VVSAPVDWLPDIALGPDHAPEAAQEAALVADQVSIEVPPLVTDVGLAASDTAGVAGEDVGAELTVPPPQAASTKASTGTSSNVFLSNIRILIPRAE
jgi:hypothetical protein